MGAAPARGAVLASVEEVERRIRQGRRMFIAADESLLRRLPAGQWIGGTIPYFIGEDGGLMSRELAAVTEVSPFAELARVSVYDARSLPKVYSDAPAHGFSLIVIPAGSATLQEFALNAPHYHEFATRPLIGWVSGVHLDDIGKTPPRVYDGRARAVYEDAALAWHVRLPRSKTAEIGILNIFEPGDGDALSFAQDGFSAREVYIDGRPRPLAAYLEEKGLDTRLPLVADYDGALVNISFQSVDRATGEVRFYAPVFRGVAYRHARPVGDYAAAFAAQTPAAARAELAYSCNCVLNYVYGRLEARHAAAAVGAATFGEIAYQLLNQTLVYLRITDTNLAERLRGEMQRRKQLDHLRALTDELDAFNAMVSHDVRAPLRRLVMLAELLRASPAGQQDAKVKDLAERMLGTAEKGSKLVEDLLAFSRAGRAELRRGPVDLGALLAEARADVEPEAAGRKVVWEVGALPCVRGDAALLKQVFVNLLSNALKYTRARVETRVEVGARREAKEDVVYVKDNGVGFDPAGAQRLFKPFSRLETAEKFPGTGMGLAIASRIVARHGGRVWASSRPGEGATFFVALP